MTRKQLVKDKNRTFFKKLASIQDGGYKCAICGRVKRDINKMTIDHKVPKSVGGTLAYQNCQVVCRRCNALKANAVTWQTIPEIDRTDARLGREICKIIQNLPKRKVISFRQIAMLLGDASLAPRIAKVLKQYSLDQKTPPASALPLHRVLDDDGYIPRFLPSNIRESYKATLRQEGLAPPRNGKLKLKYWGDY